MHCNAMKNSNAIENIRNDRMDNINHSDNPFCHINSKFYEISEGNLKMISDCKSYILKITPFKNDILISCITKKFVYSLYKKI